MRWHDKLKSFVRSFEFEKITSAFLNSRVNGQKIHWKNYRKYCNFSWVEAPGNNEFEQLEDQLSYFCLK